MSYLNGKLNKNNLIEDIEEYSGNSKVSVPTFLEVCGQFNVSYTFI